MQSQSAQSFREEAQKLVDSQRRSIVAIMNKNRAALALEAEKSDTGRIDQLKGAYSQAVLEADRLKAEAILAEERYQSEHARYIEGKSDEEIEAIDLGVQELYKKAMEHEWPWSHHEAEAQV